jgi:hypothetical protein
MSDRPWNSEQKRAEDRLPDPADRLGFISPQLGSSFEPDSRRSSAATDLPSLSIGGMDATRSGEKFEPAKQESTKSLQQKLVDYAPLYIPLASDAELRKGITTTDKLISLTKALKEEEKQNTMGPATRTAFCMLVSHFEASNAELQRQLDQTKPRPNVPLSEKKLRQ